MNIPVGVSDFTEIRQNGYYYVDKTGLICALLRTTATKVTLITRPRRFGKTLLWPGDCAGESAVCTVDEPVAGDLYFL